MNSKKGQIISGDFLVSIAVFLIVLAIVVPLFSRMSDSAKQQQFDDEVHTKMAFATDVLLKTEGSPPDWNATNVRRVGLADADGRINKTKLRNFMNMDHNSLKNMLGLSGLELNLSFHSGYDVMTGLAVSRAAYFYVNDASMFSLVNNSNLVWDMYYGGSGTPLGSGAENTYTGQAAALFDQMLGNSSEYRTIIIENAGLTQAQVNIDALKNFVNSGGLLIVEGDNQLIAAGFSMSSAAHPGGSGIIRGNEFITESPGSTVTFNSSNYYFYHNNDDSVLNIDVEESAGSAFLGHWNYGGGKIYYITDIAGNVNGKSLASVVLVVGRKAELSTGQMQDAAVDSRPVVFDTDTNSIGTATMVVGR